MIPAYIKTWWRKLFILKILTHWSICNVKLEDVLEDNFLQIPGFFQNLTRTKPTSKFIIQARNRHVYNKNILNRHVYNKNILKRNKNCTVIGRKSKVFRKSLYSGWVLCYVFDHPSLPTLYHPNHTLIQHDLWFNRSTKSGLKTLVLISDEICKIKLENSNLKMFSLKIVFNKIWFGICVKF